MFISDQTYQKLTKLISELTGIELASNRKAMLVNRVTARLQAVNIDSFEEYYELVSSVRGGVERQSLVEAITTHFTSFFRDESQFAHVRDELTNLFKRGERKIRIWSSACSSGEEPYSLAIVALEAAAIAGVSQHDIRILATDISGQILRQAIDGWYASDSLKNLTALQRTFFEPTSKLCENSGVPMLRVNKELRNLLIFRQLNLCEQPLNVPNGIDIVFCRNVLLYFKPSVQQTILKSVFNKIKLGGLLYVGASEQVRGYLPEMTSDTPCVFRKTSDASTFPMPTDFLFARNLDATCQTLNQRQ